MIDIHCHLDLYPNPAAIIERANKLGIYVLAMTTTPKALEGTRKLVANACRIKVAVGLHPELVAARYAEVSEVCAAIPDVKYVGEIGLDGSSDHSKSLPIQQRVFSEILGACSQQGGRILSVHSRGAVSLVLDALESNPNCGKPVLHWFSGSFKELERAILLDCWFSVGPIMLSNQRGLNLVKRMPKEKILTESDGPLVNYNGSQIMPWDVGDAINALARTWGLSSSEAEVMIHGSFKKLVS